MYCATSFCERENSSKRARGVIEADDPSSARDSLRHLRSAAAPGPVGLEAQVVVDRVDVDPRGIIVELNRSIENATHRAALALLGALVGFLVLPAFGEN